ncbi:hypothetical protein ACJMK2_004108 [Sinanodonta woodiana]|uniref:Uncharacterized protein n=1 Tax=Sinanodonta woodiana TaxID=1069815 RepID=A0ABD3Y300_SINWO
MKLKDLKKLGKGNKSRASDPISDQDLQKIMTLRLRVLTIQLLFCIQCGLPVSCTLECRQERKHTSSSGVTSPCN